jgi:hypothetical protein
MHYFISSGDSFPPMMHDAIFVLKSFLAIKIFRPRGKRIDEENQENHILQFSWQKQKGRTKQQSNMV